DNADKSDSTSNDYIMREVLTIICRLLHDKAKSCNDQSDENKPIAWPRTCHSHFINFPILYFYFFSLTTLLQACVYFFISRLYNWLINNRIGTLFFEVFLSSRL